MPLIQKGNSTKEVNVWIWHITEDLHFFLDQNLSNSSKKRVSSMKSESHQKGFLAVRKLLSQAGYSDEDLYYDSYGKPHLKDGKQISISHSFDYSTLIISSEKIVGIDIEKIRPKIEKIANRFQHKNESFVAAEDHQGLTRLWACKEALYKTYIGGGLSFKDDIPITSFNSNDFQTTGEVIKDDFRAEFNIYFINLPDYALAYAVIK